MCYRDMKLNPPAHLEISPRDKFEKTPPTIFPLLILFACRLLKMNCNMLARQIKKCCFFIIEVPMINHQYQVVTIKMFLLRFSSANKHN